MSKRWYRKCQKGWYRKCQKDDIENVKKII